MSGFIISGLAVIAGAGLGLVYFGGLWLTVKQLTETRQPTLLFAASLAVRLAVTLAGFYFVMDGNWQRAVACLIGFLLARQVLISRLRPKEEPPVLGKKEEA